MKTRYFIISAVICAVVAVYFLYYQAWRASTRRWASEPSGQIDLIAQMANIAMAGAIIFLALAVITAVLRAVRGKRR